jgi:hypothetical protein
LNITGSLKLRDHPGGMVRLACVCCDHNGPTLIDRIAYKLTNVRFGGKADMSRCLWRMLAAGVSRYHPDPLAALERKAR